MEIQSVHLPGHGLSLRWVGESVPVLTRNISYAILCQQFSVKPVKYNSSVLFWNIDKEFILYYCALVRMPRPWNRPMHWKWGQCTGDGANALEMGGTHWKWEPILWRWGPCTGDGAKALAVMPLHRRWDQYIGGGINALEMGPLHCKWRYCTWDSAYALQVLLFTSQHMLVPYFAWWWRHVCLNVSEPMLSRILMIN